jgi:hypothetical protein
MHRYEPSVPRVTLGIAAVAMTAATIVASVILPAKTGSDSPASQMIAASRVTGPSSMGSAPSVDAVAAREPKAGPIPCSFTKPNHKREGHATRFHVVES